MTRLAMRCVVLAVALAVPAMAAEKKLVLGVFLPTTMVDGQARFQLSERLGQALEKSLGQKVVVRNFGRFEDFEKAAAGGLDVAVVDAWAAVQIKSRKETLAVAQVDGETHHRWAVVSSRYATVKELAGKRLAVPRGVRSLDPRFVANVIFVGDVKDKHVKIVPVPNAESALAALESKEAEAALVRAGSAPKGARVIYRSSPLPGTVAVNLRGNAEELSKAFLAMEAVAPISKFVAPRANELESLERLLVQGPPKRLAMLAESPIVRPEVPVVVDMNEVKAVLPTFTDFIEPTTELPDD